MTYIDDHDADPDMYHLNLTCIGGVVNCGVCNDKFDVVAIAKRRFGTTTITDTQIIEDDATDR